MKKPEAKAKPKPKAKAKPKKLEEEPKPKKLEASLQAKFFQIIHNDPFFRYCVWSTPNGIYLGGNHSVINEMKATGALKGVWDLTVQKNGKLFFIETKIGSNGLTKEQVHFRDVRIANGVPSEHFFIYKTIDEGMELIETLKRMCVDTESMFGSFQINQN